MIDEDLTAFLEQGVSIHLGTRDDRLDPNGTRVTAVKVDEDRCHIVAYVPKVSAARVMKDLESNGHAAIVFARPTDDRACQLKGVFAGSRTATARDRAFVMRQWEDTLACLERIGLPRVAFTQWRMWPCLAIRIRVTAAFSQTPGPGAGAPLA